jgi:hypothetical protein
LFLAALPAFAATFEEVAGDSAERGTGGVLKKVWVVRNGAEVYRDTERSAVDSRLNQHSKAYHFGVSGDLIAIGDKPKKSECAHHGFIAERDVIIWDTDQALRFVGTDQESYVDLYRDEALTDKISESAVEGPDDPTVMPFPIFRRTDDGRAFEIAFIYTAASGADTYDDRIQESLGKVVTKDVSSIDVAFVMDVTGSMHNELTAAKEKVHELMNEFGNRTVELFGRVQPLRLRFAFVGYRDQSEGDAWVEIIPFAGRGQSESFEDQLGEVHAMSRLNGDWEENVCGGLKEALDLDWRRENAKVIILIGDAAPKDEGLFPKIQEQCAQRFIRIYSIVVESHSTPAAATWRSFKKMALSTGGQCFKIDDVEDTQTVDMIVETLTIEEAAVAKAPDVVRSWAEGGARMSRDSQEFLFRGVLPDESRRPIPPTVFVSSKKDGSRQVCLYKSKANLYEMLGDMQTDFVGMIENPSPSLLAAINAGGVEFIAELDPGVLQTVVEMDDLTEANLEIRSMLEVMPELPGIVRELQEKGLTAEWHELANKTAILSRFVSDPRNFYDDKAWVPFGILEFAEEER